MQFTFGSKSLSFETPVVMGILNTTPDSFSDGGDCYRVGRFAIDKALSKAAAMAEDGAQIIDIGGESTRPGAKAVSLSEELDRVIPVVEAISSELDVVISVDTSRGEVIREATAAGAGLINDVRALQLEGALQAAADSRLPVCLMHMQGDPQTMQAAPSYQQVTADVLAFLDSRISACLEVGIGREQIIIDPGFGFGKTDEHNLLLLKELSSFTDTGLPVLVGVSRKSMIGRLLNREVDERLAASISLAVYAAMQGAGIIRVHDVRATVDALKIVSFVENA